MTDLVVVEGLDELRNAMRAAADATPAELSKALKAGSVKLRGWVSAAAPRGSNHRTEGPALADSFTAYSRARSAGVISKLPYAGVQEFVKTYRRRSRNPDRASHTVTMRGATPRFAYRQLDVHGDELVQMVTDALVALLSCHGWLEVSG